MSHFHILADDYIVAEEQCEPDDKPQAHLPYHLELAVKALLVVLEHLDVVVGKAQQAEPYGSKQHKHHVHIIKAPYQEAGNEDGDNNDYASHRGNSHFVHAERIELCVTLRLRYVPALQQLNEILPEPSRNEQRQYDGDGGSYRDVAENPCAWEIQGSEVIK